MLPVAYCVLIDDAGDVYMMPSNGSGHYNSFWAAIDRTSFVFEAMAYMNVHIALTHTPTDVTKSAYIITLGVNNTESSITVLG